MRQETRPDPSAVLSVVEHDRPDGAAIACSWAAGPCGCQVTRIPPRTSAASTPSGVLPADSHPTHDEATSPQALPSADGSDAADVPALLMATAVAV